jgi:hypothetical protein
MKNPFTLEVSLKQHSPLIHFQHHQYGATLRATELKPKLDKFLIKQVFKDFHVYKKYLVEHDEAKYRNINDQEKNQYEKGIHKALDYKVTISRGENRPNEGKPYKIITENKESVFSSEVSLKIFSFHRELLNIIESIAAGFFILTNFGLRQSKGFGSFTPANVTKKDFENTLKNHYPAVYKKDIPGADNYSGIYREIQEDYQLLKSGKNFKGYAKSFLFDYMCKKKGIGWEKRQIKETLKTKHPDVFDSLMYDNRSAQENRIMQCDKRKEKSNNNYRYIRALLGLAEHNEYRASKDPQKNKLKLDKVVINIEDKEKEIQRFQSPLLFKVFENTIYILPQPIPREMFNRAFDFIMECQFLDKKKSKQEKLFTLPTPSEEEFDLEEFLDNYLNGKRGWIRIQGK